MVSLYDAQGTHYSVRLRRALYAAERGFNPLELPGRVDVVVFRGRLAAVAHGQIQAAVAHKRTRSKEEAVKAYRDMAAFCRAVQEAFATDEWAKTARELYACLGSLEAYTARNGLVKNEEARRELCRASCELLLQGIRTGRITTASPKKTLRTIARSLAARARKEANVFKELKTT